MFSYVINVGILQCKNMCNTFRDTQMYLMWKVYSLLVCVTQRNLPHVKCFQLSQPNQSFTVALCLPEGIAT